MAKSTIFFIFDLNIEQNIGPTILNIFSLKLIQIKLTLTTVLYVRFFYCMALRYIFAVLTNLIYCAEALC